MSIAWWSAPFLTDERRMRPFVAANRKLAPAFITRVALPSARAARSAMIMREVLDRLPGKDCLMGKKIEPVHRAATAIELPMCEPTPCAKLGA